ncbi:hypothetical protein D9611_009742 [Ephemerocybe angulata]|uniref:Conserved Oligomeric Golgi complex subunit 6 C-terminal domain-containing protein n=1 Tax=Ephemerocybe angulata TaxID=980116 RepID=A0A8H5FFX7_9AGAR|nr:hypothetical protein D9611_009742 [Tulosesus angulatus]
MLVLQARASAFLTGPGGLPRPIELHAHDPIRYVGDMLAWVHQSIAAEREILGTTTNTTLRGAGVVKLSISSPSPPPLNHEPGTLSKSIPLSAPRVFVDQIEKENGVGCEKVREQG